MTFFLVNHNATFSVVKKDLSQRRRLKTDMETGGDILPHNILGQFSFFP